jgi:uncharacterized tellurite resistance protein B-like protein
MWLMTLTEAQRKALIGLAQHLIHADYAVDPSEEFMLEDFRRQMKLYGDSGAPRESIEELSARFDSHMSRSVALLNLLRLCYADGSFDVEEETLMLRFAEALKFSDADYRVFEDWVRRLAQLEQEGKKLMLS